MFASNETSAFVHRHLSRSPGDMRYLRRIGRKLDTAGLGRKKRGLLMSAKQDRVRVHRQKRDVRVAAQEKRNTLINGVTPILDPEYWRTMDRRSITIEKHIKPQLYWHKHANPSAKIVLTGKKDDLITTLLSAINTYNSAHSREPSCSQADPTEQALSNTAPNDADMLVDEAETDCDYEEEELFHS